MDMIQTSVRNAFLLYLMLLITGCSEHLTGIIETASQVKKSGINAAFTLPVTTIEFDLAEPSVVTLIIYDDQGKAIATILDHVEMEDGQNEVEFDASALTSGMYLYEITAQSIENPTRVFHDSKRMILVK